MKIPTSSPILFYDGSCGLCHLWVRFLLRHDHHALFLFAPLQGQMAVEQLPSVLRSPLSTVALQYHQNIYTYSAAIIRLLWLLGGYWKVLAALLYLIPFPIRDLGYWVVSRLRFLIFEKLEFCPLPSPENRKRFLE